MGRRVGLALAAFAVLALAGCGSSNTSGGAADAVAPAPAQQPGEVGKGQQPGEADRSQQQASARQEQQLVRTASLELRAADVAGTVTRLKDLVAAEGGYSAQENATSGHASVTLRVPGDRLDGVLKSVGELADAEVVRREVRTEDVTEQVVDVEARLANQRASVDRVRALLDRASTTAEITEVEAELTQRLSELESLQRRYEKLKGQVAMSTLTVTVASRGEPAVVVEEDDGFLGAFADGWRALTTAVGWLLVVLGALLPFALVLGVPAAGFLWWRRRHRAVAADARPATADARPATAEGQPATAEGNASG